MRKALIQGGGALAGLGVILLLVCLVGVNNAADRVEEREQVAQQVTLDNSAEMFNSGPDGPAGEEVEDAQAAVDSAEDRLDTWRAWRTVSFALIGAGVVLAAIGLGIPRGRVSAPSGVRVGDGNGGPLPASRQAQPSAAMDMRARLEALTELRDSGAISNEEYDRRRERMLDEL